VRNSTSRVTILWTLPLLATLACSSRQPGANQSAPGVNRENLVTRPEIPTIDQIDDSVGPSAGKLLRDYNSRNLGSPGWRRVSMELMTDSAVTKTFTIVNLWRDVGKQVQTLFFLEEPQGLRGTAYLLQEDEDHIPDMNVHLYLPAGERRVLEVGPDNFDEGLLGSDFTYSDVRMRLPGQGYRYRLLGSSNLRNEPVWVLEAEPSSDLTRRSRRWARARFYLARNFQFLLGADYFGDSEDEKISAGPLKQMRVVAFEQIDGVWTATRMFMFGTKDNTTLLNMKGARFGVASVDSNLFDPTQLPSLTEKLGAGGFTKTDVDVP
jgi:hypothetical protein